MDTTSALIQAASQQFNDTYGTPPLIAAYAPGRIEVLGNHTDYNEGYVISAAINLGTCFLLAPRQDNQACITAGNLTQTVQIDSTRLQPVSNPNWANYVIGVAEGLKPEAADKAPRGWQALFLSNIPRGAGLSSSAALEMSAALVFSHFWKTPSSPLALAQIGQRAEHDFAGVRCGLLDQISSLNGQAGHLIQCDFRSLEINNLPLEPQACFIVVDSGHRHTLADGAYNERRQDCEAATRFFNTHLDKPVAALRDVSMQNWLDLKDKLPGRIARRAAHIIGENQRVCDAADALLQKDLAHFGFLMFESHHSSIVNFENSCPQLDAIIDFARKCPQVIGARLSGGGFGGSAILLTLRDHADQLIEALIANTPNQDVDKPLIVSPSAGARLEPIRI